MSHQSELIASDILEYLKQHENKDMLRFIACGNVDKGFVNEFHGCILKGIQKQSPDLRGFVGSVKPASDRGHVDRVLVQRAFDSKGHLAVHQGEQGVVLADADVHARMELGATLAHDDRACADLFATKSLDAKHLGLGVTTVSR